MDNNFSDGQLVYTGNESNPVARLLKKLSPARNVNHSEDCLSKEIFMEQFSGNSELISLVLSKAKKSGTYDYNRKIRAGVLGGIGGVYGGIAGGSIAAGIKQTQNWKNNPFGDTNKGVKDAAALGAGVAGSALGIGLPVFANKLIDRNFKKEIKYRLSLGDITEEDLKKYLDGNTTPAMKTVLKSIQGQLRGAGVARTDK